ncbi:MAG: succinate dehydrogenase/fumarate reductase transmembrane subunit [Deltaproteobacteria bacterium]
MSAEAIASPVAQGRRYTVAKIGSFVGLVPLGLWTAVHLWSQLAAFNGAAAWSRSVTEFPNRSGELVGLTLLLFFIVWHAIWGFQRMGASKPNGYAHLGNARWWLQRLSAIGLFFFIGAHVWLAKLHPLLETGQPESFADMAAHMAHHAPTLVVYILGVAALAYHLGNGLSNFCFSFGLVTSQRGLAWSARVAFLVVLGLLAVGWLAIYALWQAGQPLPIPLD